jgi:nitronate monooxygenase
MDLVMKRFSPAMLKVPVIAAPMAGGPSTPELAAAVTNAGGLGFIAAGLIPAELLAQRIAAARRLTSGPLGVNLFAPQPTTGSSAQFAVYASTLTDEAARYRVLLGEPRHDDDDWAAKMDVIGDLRPEVVSFTFGLPTVYENKRLTSAGITSASTVTTLREAQLALACGADVLVAQGPSAGGHRATFDPVAEPAAEQLNELLAALVARVEAPIVAAGGLATSDDVHGALGAGAVTAQCETAFLLADEAGTKSRPPCCIAGPRVHRDRGHPRIHGGGTRADCAIDSSTSTRTMRSPVFPRWDGSRARFRQHRSRPEIRTAQACGLAPHSRRPGSARPPTSWPSWLEPHRPTRPAQ